MESSPGYQSILREGIEQGIEQGIERGIEQTLLRLIELRLGSAPMGFAAYLDSLSREGLERLQDTLLACKDDDALRAALGAALILPPTHRRRRRCLVRNSWSATKG